MSDTTDQTGGAGPSHRGVEIGVAAAMAVLALAGIYGSLQVGIRWGPEGPRAGFFPFYVSLIVLMSCVVNVLNIIRIQDRRVFATWLQLRKVASVVLPTAIYVLIIPYTGIYLASALLIAAFMTWLGGYRWAVALPVAIVLPVFTFLMFEIWFLVPLPKGPLEIYLGY
jgi:hypothetical protein